MACCFAHPDAQIGKFINWLKQSNLYDNTLIVITSGHGEACGEKGLVLLAVYNGVPGTDIPDPVTYSLLRGRACWAKSTPTR